MTPGALPPLPSGEGWGEGLAGRSAPNQPSPRGRGLCSPISRQLLHHDTPHSLAAKGERWPVVDGIPFLRTNRDDLVAETLQALDRGRPAEATALLLGDQDDWARTPPASLRDRRALLREADRISFREAMDRLAFGGVGTYFAHRWSDPTFLSGLALAEAHWRSPANVFELACGAGHYLREFARAGAQAQGGDVVWAKLWLARHYVAPGAGLICFDAARPWPLPDRAAGLVFCHDAFYFLPDKPHVASEMQRVSVGPVLVGHAHNALVDNLSAGAPLSPAAYAALFDAPLLYDDAELTVALREARAPRAMAADALGRAAAVSLASCAGSPMSVAGGLAMPRRGTALRRNPLYIDGAVAWPSPRYEAEYGKLATYPMQTDASEAAVMGEQRTEEWARTRELLDLPRRW